MNEEPTQQGLFEPFELEKLLDFCEQRQGFTASLQKDPQLVSSGDMPDG